MPPPEDWQAMVDRERAEDYRKHCHLLSNLYRNARTQERNARRAVRTAHKAALAAQGELMMAIHHDAQGYGEEDSLCFAKLIDDLSRRLETAQEEEREAKEEASLCAARAATAQEQLKRATTTFLSPIRQQEARSRKKAGKPAIEETLPNGTPVPSPEVESQE